MLGGKKIAINTLVIIFSSIVNLAIGLFTTSIIARSIGPALYGRYTFGLNFILLFSVFSNFGLESLYVRETARDKKNLIVITDIFNLKILIAFATIINIVIFAHILNYPNETILVIYILCVGLFFQILSESLLSIYRAIEKMGILSIFSIFFRISGAIIVVLSIISGIGFLGIVAAFTISNFIVFCTLLLFVQKQFRILHLNINPKIWKALIKKGFPFYASALLTMSYLKINIIIISKLVSEKEMGFFMAALTLVENLFFLPNAFNVSIFPAYSRIYGESQEALKITYQKITKILIIITTSVIIGTNIISKEIIFFIFGEEFLYSVTILKILIIFWGVSFFTQTQSMLLFSVNKEKAQVIVMGIACFLTIIANYVFINFFGVIGAAYSSVIVETFVVMLFSIILWKTDIKYTPDNHIYRLIFPLLGLYVITELILKTNLFLSISAGGLIFIGFLFLFRVFDNQDILLIKSFFKR